MHNTFRFYKPQLGMLLCMLLATGCQKEVTTIDSFLAISESQQDESKTILKDETFVYWENNDQIDICCEDQSEKGVATFSIGSADGNNNQKAIFDLSDNPIKVTTDKNMIALFPSHNNNTLSSVKDVTINFPQEQGWRDENSFASAACPMVAYGNLVGNDGLLRMQFHNLCGLVRLQIVNTDNAVSSATLKELRVTSQDSKKLSGRFQVHDIEKNAPYVTATTDVTNVITITPNAGTVSLGETGLVFYLALPALSGTGSTAYSLKLKVVVTSNGNDYQMEKDFGVNIRRNGLSKMPALHCSSWVQGTDGSGSGATTTTHITGNGTTQRPFLIYSVDDLVELREVCNSNNFVINGFSFNNDPTHCQFRIMRSDIVLTSDNWTEPIHEFPGVMTYFAAQGSSQPGIVNNSGVPIFNVVTGSVTGLTVNGTYIATLGPEEEKNYSPLCLNNQGTLLNCMIGENCTTVFAGSTHTRIGGICLENNGLISGCGCHGTLVAEEVGCISHTNNSGTNVSIERCYVASPTRTDYRSNYAKEAGGICHTNQGKIENCYFSANSYKCATKWGGIVYKQASNSASVKRCYIDASGIIQSSNSVGGIVNTMSDGVVDYCWNNADLMQADNQGLGGIVYALSGGEVRNCCLSSGTGMMKCTNGVVGGIVGRLSGTGTVYNSYANADFTQTTVTKGTAVGTMTGGTIANSYGLQPIDINMPHFVGSKTGGSITHCYGYYNAGNEIPTNENVNDYAALRDNLNGWPSATEGGWPATVDTYRAWVQSGTNPPSLSTSAFLPNTSKKDRR